MRGNIFKRFPGSWMILLDYGYRPDPTNPGKRKRHQKNITFKGSKKEAQDELVRLLSEANSGTRVEPSKLTVAEWLSEWVDAALKPRCRPSTYVRYRGIIDNQLVPGSFGNVPLQLLRPIDIEAYFAEHRAADTPLSASTLSLHHTILHSALRKAKKDKLVPVNAAEDLDGKPTRTRNHASEEARQHAWTKDETKAFLAAAKTFGPQAAAFYSLAVDSGARKGELCGLKWTDLDLVAGKMIIARTLITPGPDPVFGPTKTGATRTITFGAELIDLLKAHKKEQAAVKMKHRTTYRDLGLVFANDTEKVGRGRNKVAAPCGVPLQMNNLGQREFADVIATAGIRPIKFHGLRHTCATLLLQARTPVHVVSERLGHAKVSMTMEVYAHVLPDMQQEAATILGGLLHGNA